MLSYDGGVYAVDSDYNMWLKEKGATTWTDQPDLVDVLQMIPMPLGDYLVLFGDSSLADSLGNVYSDGTELFFRFGTNIYYTMYALDATNTLKKYNWNTEVWDTVTTVGLPSLIIDVSV